MFILGRGIKRYYPKGIEKKNKNKEKNWSRDLRVSPLGEKKRRIGVSCAHLEIIAC